MNVKDDKGKPHIQKDVLIAYSPLDMGLEVVTVVKYKLDDNDYLLDGEILDDTKKGITELIRMPIALMSIDYLERVFGGSPAPFEYTRGPEPSIEIDRAPDPDEVWLFEFDIHQRMSYVERKKRDEWKEKRFGAWFDKFRQNFFDHKGRTSKNNLSRLFVPATAKILNIYFSKSWVPKVEQ